MKTKLIRWLAIYLILQAGVLNFMMAQDQYEKIQYLGYLAITNAAVTLVSAFLIYHRQRLGWWLGLLVALEAISLYAAARVIALPGQAIEPWLYPYGVVGAVVEGLFILLFIFVQPWRANLRDNEPASRIPLTYLLPVLGILLASVVSYGSYRWDRFAYQLGYHVHVGSYSAVCNTPFTTFEELEEKYGIQVSMAALSMMDGIVDVRLKITDPDKAEKLIVNQAALLVDTEYLILAPHHHNHFRLIKDKVHYMFFPTQNGKVYRGAEVSLVIGTVRVEPVIVQ